MTTAINCVVCDRPISPRRHVVLLGTRDDYDPARVVCTRCMQNSNPLHARFWPDCPEAWHDLYDHPHALATKAAAVYLLDEAAS
jgi:hypothetical protein